MSHSKNENEKVGEYQRSFADVFNVQVNASGEVPCVHCNKCFKPTPYKLRKHYYVCDDCVRAKRQQKLTGSGNISLPSGKLRSRAAQHLHPVPANNLPAQVAAIEEPEPVKAKESKIESFDATAKYVPQNGEVDDLRLNIGCGLNTLLTGPTQCGKTTLAYFVAEELKREIITIQGGAGATFERIIAKDALVEENGVTVTVRPSVSQPSTWSVLPQAMAKGSILYIDEPNVIPSEVLMYLFSAMDWRHTITFDDGTTLQAKEGFCVICAMNEGQGYTGTSQLNAAFRARSQAIIDMDYLPANREAALVIDRTGIDKDTAKKLTEAAAALRASLKAKTIRTPIGTSALLACGLRIKQGASLARSIRLTMINQVPSDKDSERRAVEDVLAAFFGKELQS